MKGRPETFYDVPLPMQDGSKERAEDAKYTLEQDGWGRCCAGILSPEAEARGAAPESTP